MSSKASSSTANPDAFPCVTHPGKKRVAKVDALIQKDNLTGAMR